MIKWARRLFTGISLLVNKSIRNKIIVFFIPLTIVLIIAVALVSFAEYYYTMKNQIVKDTTKIIEQVGYNVDFYFSDVKTPMVMVARNPNVTKALKEYYSMDYADRLYLERDIEDVTNNINSFKNYIGDIIIVGKNGFKMNLRNSSPVLYNYDFMKASWLQDIINRKKIGIQYISSHTCDYYEKINVPYEKIVSAVLPIADNNGMAKGYIICDINLRKMNQIFNSLDLGKGGIIYMIDQEGKIIFHPRENLIESQIDDNIKKEVLGREKGSFSTENNGASDLFIFSKSKVTGWTLVAEIPHDYLYEPAVKTKNIIMWVILISIFCTIVISLIIARQIRKPLNTLLSHMERIENNDFYPYENNYGYGEIAEIGKSFESMVSKVNMLINDVYISKMRQKEAEFEVLRGQINPHFLYNALQLVKAEAVFEGNKEISNIITSLAYLLRYTMNNKKDTAKIIEEVEYAKYYMDIYKRRFENKFDFFIDMDHSLDNCLMPKLILQPIIENSLKHGLQDVKTGGIVNLLIFRDDQNLHFEIFDNGCGMEENMLERLRYNLNIDSEKSIGLHNVHQRLILKYGLDSGIQVDSQHGNFTKVSFILPIISERGENFYA